MSNVAVEKIEDGSLVTEPMSPRILLVDDEEPIRGALNTILLQEGYSVYQAHSGKEAVERVHSTRPDLILLDVGLPDMEGKDVIRRLRGGAVAPIIVISAHDEVSEKVTFLDSGAHDYLTKPFSTPELLARIRAALRNISPTRDVIFTVGDLKVDLARRKVFVGGTPLRLTATEYDLLKVLIHHAGKVRTHHELIRELWGRTQYQDPVHLLRVTLSHLRHKLQVTPMRPSYIVTEPGVGYRIRTAVAAYWRDATQSAEVHPRGPHVRSGIVPAPIHGDDRVRFIRPPLSHL